MWAMIPMLRTRSSASRVPATDSALVVDTAPALPAVVRERLVGLGHPVHVVLLLERAALLVDRVQRLAGELLVEALLATVARRLHEPAHGQRAAAAGSHLDRHLVVRTAHAP